MSVDTAVKPSLTIKRRFKASPAKVFAAWTDPEKIKRWMGPGEIDTVKAESDPACGGRYLIMMQSPTGEQHDVGGVYREIVADEKLVFTWAWKSAPERESLVTVVLKPDGDGTLLTSDPRAICSTKRRATAIDRAGTAHSTSWKDCSHERHDSERNWICNTWCGSLMQESR